MTRHDPKTLPRIKLGYGTLVGRHHMTLHVPMGTTSTDAETIAGNLCNVLKGFLYTTQSFDTLDASAAGSNVFNPIVWTPIVGTSTGTIPTNNKATVWTWVARDSLGNRGRLFMFSDFRQADANYRVTSAELSAVAAVVAFLNTAGCGIVNAAGIQPVWKAYANISDHDYWVRRARA